MKIKNIKIDGKLKFIHIYYSDDELEDILNKFDGFIYNLYKYKRGNIISLMMSNKDDQHRNHYVLKINDKEKNINKSRMIEKDLYNLVINLAKKKGIVMRWDNLEFKNMYIDNIEKKLISDIDDSKVDMEDTGQEETHNPKYAPELGFVELNLPDSFTISTQDIEVLKHKFCTAKDQQKYELFKHKGLKFKTSSDEFEWSLTDIITCKDCNRSIPRIYFATNTSSSDPFGKNHNGEGCIRLRRGECLDCGKKAGESIKSAKKLAKDNGISYKASDIEVCAICEKPPRKGNGLVFDHCHKKNVFRGYCCNSCNRSMGVLGDDVSGMIKVINYLNKTEKLNFQQNSEGDLMIS
jgi:hypothetical protein